MTEQYKDFFLHNPIIFEGSLCLLTGSNGVGKTRLLRSISSGITKVTMDDENISTNQISLLDIDDFDLKTPFRGVHFDEAESLSKTIFNRMNLCESSDELPTEDDISLDPNQHTLGMNIFNIKEIVCRAEELLNKKMKDLSQLELKLSIVVSNEVINGRVNINGAPFISSISQLTLNYYKAIEINELLQVKARKHPSFSFLSEEDLLSKLGDTPPNELFNELLSETFRGKFKISPPDPKCWETQYNPNLLNSNNQNVDIVDLSDGERILFWLTSKIFECAVSKPENIFGKKKIILLDEPDNKLHPKMIVDFYKHLLILIDKLGLVILFTTHSPTTAALCPLDNFFNISHEYQGNKYDVVKTTKDGSISRLLEGVTQISINPDNARQVYVENERDRIIYQSIYNELKKTNTKFSEDISLHFMSSGIKPSEKFLENAIKPIIKNQKDVDEIINRITGAGNCEMAIGSVEFHTKGGSKTVRALIDWDCNSREVIPGVIKFAEGNAYSIENIIYDPLSLFAFLSFKNPKLYSSEYFLNGLTGIHWRSVLNNTEQCQLAIDKIIHDILDRKNKRDYEIEYVNGVKLLSDKEFYIPSNGETKYGHFMEGKILNKYDCLRALSSNRIDMTTMYNFYTTATLALVGPEFLNVEFERAFLKLQ